MWWNVTRFLLHARSRSLFSTPHSGAPLQHTEGDDSKKKNLCNEKSCFSHITHLKPHKSRNFLPHQLRYTPHLHLRSLSATFAHLYTPIIYLTSAAVAICFPNFIDSELDSSTSTRTIVALSGVSFLFTLKPFSLTSHHITLRPTATFERAKTHPVAWTVSTFLR